MAETTTDNPHSHTGRNPLILAALIVLLVAILGFMYHQNKQQKTTSNLPAGWTEYKSDQYGFKLNYPKEWGSPTIDVSHSSDSKHYDVRFFVKTGIPTLHFISMDSDSSGVTKDKVQKAIKSSSTNVMKKDDSSYAAVDVYPAFDTQSQLSIKQIVNLPKVNVSAVTYTHLINGKLTNCPVGRFSPVGDKNCITEKDYDTGSKVIKSIKAI